MSYPINYPTPQGADVQIFYAGTSDWVKPQGCSFVFALLVGAGGNGADGTTSDGGGGGGSGAVMTALMPAFLMPDQLRVLVPAGGAGSNAAGARLIYQAKDGTGYILFGQSNGSNASGASPGSGGTASGFNAFGAACITQSVAGQSGTIPGNNVIASNTTFLSGGAGGATSQGGNGSQVSINYGYPTLAGGTGGLVGGNGRNGISVLSNLIVSQGGSGGGGANDTVGGAGGKGGFGSGGGGGGRCNTGTSLGGNGGDGLIVLISW